MRLIVLTSMILISTFATMVAPASAQDIKPDPADVEAVGLLLRTATGAMLEKDAKTFVSCCDTFVDCFFYDGTLVKGTRTIERTLGEYFARRPAGAIIKLDPVPRSYRVLSPDIMMVDWPATIRGPERFLKVNTLTTVRKVDGKWSITSFLESVPYPSPSRTPSPD